MFQLIPWEDFGKNTLIRVDCWSFSTTFIQKNGIIFQLTCSCLITFPIDTAFEISINTVKESHIHIFLLQAVISLSIRAGGNFIEYERSGYLKLYPLSSSRDEQVKLNVVGQLIVTFYFQRLIVHCNRLKQTHKSSNTPAEM